MSHVIHRDPPTQLPVAVAGQGIHVTDSTGKRYMEASGGAAISCRGLGHGHPYIVAAIWRQAEALEYAHTSFFNTEAAERLADHLVASAPEGLS